MQADQFFKNCRIYSMDEKNTTYESMALKDGKIVFLGTVRDASAYCDDTTEIIELKGQTVFPGFSESHTHAPGLAYDILFNVNLYDTLSQEEILDKIRTFVESNPQKEMYYGRGFNCGYFDGEEAVLGPRKEHLDAICQDKPIILSDFGGNCLWLNSKALEKFKITADTVCPPGGEIQLDPQTGELWGIVRNEARIFVPYQEFTEEENYQAAKWFQDVMHKNGYTAVLALRPPGTVEPRTTLFHAFKTLEDRGELTLWVDGARDLDPLGDIDAQIEEMFRTKEKYDSERMRLTTAKFFLDGVVEGLDGYLLQPYENTENKAPDFRGKLFWDKEKLTYAFQRCMEAGFQIHCHAIGDGATHDALDALAEAAARIQPGDYRNTLTHLQLVDEADKKRMAKLGVIANVQTYWHFKSPVMFPIETKLLGDRAENEYPLKSLVDHGVTIVASSDFPVTPEPNPFYAIQAGVTRNLYDAKSFGLEKVIDPDDPTYLLNAKERVSLEEMLRAFTINAAYSRFQEGELGSLSLGKAGDFIVLDQDPFAIAPMDLETIRVLATYFGGKKVFELAP